MTHSTSIDALKDTPPAAANGLDVGVMPFEMSPEAKNVLAQALEAEQWLQRIGLHGIVTGLATHDMRDFRAACERLVERFKAARAAGRADAGTDSEHKIRAAIDHGRALEAELARQRQWNGASVPRVVAYSWALAAGAAGVVVGLLLSILLG